MKNICFFAIALLTVLASCGSSEKFIIQGIPYQEEKGDRWSMVATDGSVMFEDEFKLEPTLMSCDRFFVRDSEGLYSLYKLDGDKPEEVASGFKNVSLFCGGRAIVAREGQHVSIIDTEGKEIKKLDKIAGKVVQRVWPFYNGVAVFVTNEGMSGVVDKEGKCIIKPEYTSINQSIDGYFVAVKGTDGMKISFDLLDSDGKKVFSKKMGDGGYSEVGMYWDGMLPVATGEFSEQKWSVLDKDGKELIKPSEKYDRLYVAEGNRIVCVIDGEWGLIDKDGETKVRPKCSGIDYVGNGKWIACRDNDECFLMDKDGERLGDTKFDRMSLPYLLTGDDALLVRKERKDYRLLDSNGNKIEDCPDMESVGCDGLDCVETDATDYVDMSEYE